MQETKNQKKETEWMERKRMQKWERRFSIKRRGDNPTLVQDFMLLKAGKQGITRTQLTKKEETIE